MVRPRNLMLVAGAAVAAVAVIRRGRRAAREHQVPGGTLIADAGVYDTLSRLLLGPLVKRIAADVAAVVPKGAQIFEVGCGPGLLSLRLGRQHRLQVTGLDLDPAMIVRARANADRPGSNGQRQPSFLVGDVAALAFPDRSFDLVVSTLSMHHWADPAAAWPRSAACSARVAGRSSGTSGRASAHIRLDHATHTCPIRLDQTHGSPLQVENATPWHWPWRFALTQRVQLIRANW